jgi:hypothetical protein
MSGSTGSRTMAKWLQAWWRGLSHQLARPSVRRLLAILLAVASLLFLGYAVYANRQLIQEGEWRFNGWMMALAFLIYPAGYAPLILSWVTTMGMLDARLDFWTHTRLYSLSNLPKRIPGPMWYIGSRTMLYKAQGVSHSRTLIGTALETVGLILSGLVTYVIFVALSPLAADLRLLIPGVVAAFAVGLLVWRIAWVNRLIRWLAARSGGEWNLTLARRQLLMLMGGYAIAWIGGGVVLYILGRGVVSLPLDQVPFFIGCWAGAGVVSVVAQFVVGNMGLRELALATLLSTTLPVPTAVLLSILFRLLLMIGEFLWSLAFAGMASWVLGRPAAPNRRN